jgi:hypothetical protein
VDKKIGYECQCNPGFQVHAKDSRLCADIDECERDHPCSQHCRNTMGSYVCSCGEGYILKPDEHSCKANSSKYQYFTLQPKDFFFFFFSFKVPID